MPGTVNRGTSVHPLLLSKCLPRPSGLISFVILLSVFIFTTGSSTFAAENSSRPKIAIIIDDLGYKLHEGQQSIELKHPLTLAIIPGSPHAKALAEAANCKDDKEIMVHLPMTPNKAIAWETGLNTSMNEEEFTFATKKLLANVPYAIGVNNHGGSLLTQDRTRMDWLMAILGQSSLFFVDSRTTAESVAEDAARSAQIPFNARDIFLDNERSKQAIERQLDKLVNLASQHGQAVAIGHPYKETLEVLESRLGEIQAQGIDVVGISHVLHQNNNFAVKKPLVNSASGL